MTEQRRSRLNRRELAARGPHDGRRHARAVDEARPAARGDDDGARGELFTVELDARGHAAAHEDAPDVPALHEARARGGRRLRERARQLPRVDLGVVGKAQGATDLRADVRLEGLKLLARQRLDAQAARRLPGAAGRQLRGARTVERDGEHARVDVANVDAGRVAQLGRERRVKPAAAQAEIEQRAGRLGLHLRAEDAGGGARGLGARDAALDDGDAHAALREAQRDGAPHDAPADDGDVRCFNALFRHGCPSPRRQIPSVGAAVRCRRPSSDFDVHTWLWASTMSAAQSG